MVRPGSEAPICLDGIVQDLLRLHDRIHTHVKGEADSSAGINIVGGIPAKNRLVGTQGRSIDGVRRIAAAHITHESQVAAAQVVEHTQVIRGSRSVIVGGHGHRQDVGGIGIGYGKRLGQLDVRFGDLDVDLAEV